MDPTNLPLRDFHLPAPVGWWPPAYGWWILGGLGVLLLLGVFWIWKRLTRPGVIKIASKELEQLRQTENLSDKVLVRKLSIWLRRVCITHYPRAEAAGLTGESWLRFLDRPLGDDSFTHGIGQVLIDGPYRSDVEIDSQALLTLCERWLESLREAKVVISKTEEKA